MTVLPFLADADRMALLCLRDADPPSPNLAFETFALAVGKDLKRDYRGADLIGYDLRGQDLGQFDLTGADLRSADLRGAYNFDADKLLIQNAVLDEADTRAPVDPPVKWLARWSVLYNAGRGGQMHVEIQHVLEALADGWPQADVARARRLLNKPTHATIAGQTMFSFEEPFALHSPPSPGPARPPNHGFDGARYAPSLVERWLLSSRDMAIELGTANTSVYLRGRGIIIDEPSVVALGMVNGERRVIAVGSDAKLMMGRSPLNVELLRPMRDGVIADENIAAQMINHFVRKAGGRFSFPRSQVALVIPNGATGVDRRVARIAAQRGGAGKIWLIDATSAAALGAGMPIGEASCSMIVDIGGGTTDIAVLSKSRTMYSTSVRVGGDKMDEALCSYVRRNHNLLIGEGTAERIKIEVGSAIMPSDGVGKTIHIKGRDLAHAVPKEIALNTGQIVEALADCVGAIVEGVRAALEDCGPALATNIVETGVMLTGGGALLSGIAEALRDQLSLPVTVANNPRHCAALGAGRAFEEVDHYHLLTKAP